MLKPVSVLALALSVMAACSRAVPPTSAPVVATTPQLGARVLADTGDIAFLLREGATRSRVRDDLRYLTDVIGPRLTGSAAMRRANEWTAAKLREYGMDSVSLEPWPFGGSWTRWPIWVRLFMPAGCVWLA